MFMHFFEEGRLFELAALLQQEFWLGDCCSPWGEPSPLASEAQLL